MPNQRTSAKCTRTSAAPGAPSRNTLREDFGDRRVVWILRHQGNTYATTAHTGSMAYLLEHELAPAPATRRLPQAPRRGMWWVRPPEGSLRSQRPQCQGHRRHPLRAHERPGRQSAGEMAHIRFGITWLTDEDFAEIVAERERLWRERENRPAGQRDGAVGHAVSRIAVDGRSERNGKTEMSWRKPVRCRIVTRM